MNMDPAKRVLSMILAMVLLLGNVPSVASATDPCISESLTETIAMTEPMQEIVPTTEPPVLTTAPTECATEPIPVETCEPTQPEAVPEETASSSEENVEEVAEISSDDTFPEPIQLSMETSPEEIEARFAVYARSLLYGEDFPQTYGTLGRDRLNVLEQYVYDQLLALANNILSGDSDSVYLKLNFNDIGAKLSDLPKERLKVVFDILDHDHPYELYWLSSGTYVYLNQQNELYLWLIPAAPYKPDDFAWYENPTVNLYDAERARTARKNAMKVVSDYARYSDYYKIGAYVDKICELVNYDHDAADNATIGQDVNPWRLINAFDNDPETNIVCAGYAEAMQYLMDMSVFQNDVECYSIIGNYNGVVAGHEWNIIRIAGKSYFLDVTGCDAYPQPHRGIYFLKAPSGNISAGYTVAGQLYSYMESTKSFWGTGPDSILNLADTDYDPDQWAVTMTQAELEAELTHCDGTYWLDKHVLLMSDLVLRETELTIAPGGKLEIAAGATLKLEDNAVINLNTDSLVIVEKGGELTPIEKVHYRGGTLQSTTAGLCGDHAYWQFDDTTGTLHLSGSGKIRDYTLHQNYPWATLVNDGKIRKLVVHDGITRIGSWSFYKVTSLEEVILPDSVTQIGEGAFSSCLSLRPFALPNKLITIEKDAFWNCNSLKSIIIPASVESIGEAAFRYCFGLKHITFLGNPPTFNRISDAYNNFGNVTASVNYPIGNPSWTDAVRQTYGGELTWLTDCVLGHVEGALSEEKPTCTETGLTEGKCCLICNEIFIAQSIISALGHSEIVDIYTAPTCTVQGLTEGSHCDRCGEIFVAQTVIDALGHTEVIDEAVDPDCTNTGLTEGKHCSICNEVLVAQEVIDALGHFEVIDAAVDPTCTETGLTEGQHCYVCDEVYVPQEEIPALGHKFTEQNEEIVCTVCGETVTIHIHQDYVALDIYENPQVQLNVDVSPKTLEDDLQWRIEGSSGVLEPVQNGLVTASHAGTAYVVAELTVDGYTISSRCRVDVTENVQVKGVQLSTNKVTTELYKDEYATFEILLDLPQNYPFVGDALMVTDDAAMAASGLENKSNLIKSVQFKNISDLFVLELMDDRTVQIVPTQKAMETGKSVKSSYTDTVIVKIKGEDEPRKEELNLTLSVKKNLPKPKAKINAFNSFYEGQSQEIVITGVDVTGVDVTGVDVTGIRVNENVATPIPNWLTLEDGCLKLNGNAPKSSDKAYLWVDVEGFRYPVELTLTVKHSKKAPTLKFAKSSVTLNKAAEQQIEVAVTSSDAAYAIEDTEIRITGGKTGELEAFYDNGMLIVTTTAKTPDKGTYKVYIKTPGCKEVATTVKVVNTEPSVSYKAATLDLNFPEQVVAVVPTFKNYSGDFKIESMHAQNAKKLYVDFFQVEKDGKNILVTCDEDTPTGSYNLTVKLKLDDGQTINGTAKVSVKRTAVKLKLSSSKVSLNKELSDQAVVEVICATENYNFDLKDAVLTYDGKMLDIVPVGNALVIKLKNGAEFKKTYPVSISAYKNAPAVKLSVAVLKKGSVAKSTIKATGTLDVIREGTAITVTSSYTNYLNVNVDEDAVLKIYSSKDSFKKAIAEVYAENGIFTIDGSIIGNHTLKYKAQLETKIYEDKDPIKSNQISLSVKMGAAKLTAKSSGTTLFAKDRNDRAVVWFEAADATLNDVESVKIKDVKYKDVFEIIDYRDGSFAIAFKDGKLHESIAKQLEKKSSISITLSLDVFMEGNESAKANTTQKVKLTIVK